MGIIVAETVSDVKKYVREWKREGLSIGLVPTMGFLHEGHASLIRKAVEQNDRVIVSDFVNPIQFGPTEDLESYPRDFEADRALCENLRADMIFHPAPEEMYAPDFSTHVDVDNVSAGLCGARRPIHFRGVCTVVSKLFNISQADRAYFGQKDAQQLAVVRRMVRDLNFNIEIIGCPIIREEDGLAKSSRNTYLSKEERKAAVVLSRALAEARALVENGERNAAVVREKIQKHLESEPLARVDYVELVDWDGDLDPVETIEGPVLCAIAVYIGKTRLIDNVVFQGE